MNKKYKFTLFIPLTLLLFLLFIGFIWKDNVAVLDTKGWIALQEGRLLVFSTLVMLVIVIPVFILTFIFVWKYRASNEKAKYDPDWSESIVAETIWWGFPCAIILVLSIVAWKATHQLDPYKTIENGKKPLTVQVVALDWKWLFIYPEQEIAAINFLQIPVDTPINFEITADAPMNTFWIPELSGQIFAMPNMRTKLHVIANETGDFYGSSANLSGTGFSGMWFITRASSEAEFEKWVQSTKQSGKALGNQEYIQIAQQSENNPVELFSLKTKDLFDQIIMKYMMPQGQKELAETLPHYH